MKKVKKYIWFVLVSCLCSFITGHKQQTASGKTTFRFGFPLANAKWCPKGTEFLDSDGECCAGSFDRQTGLCNDGTCGWGKFWNIEQDMCRECDAVSHWRGGYHVWSGIAPKDCRKCGYKIYGSYCVNDECGADEFWDSKEKFCNPCAIGFTPLPGEAGYSLSRISASDCKKCGWYPENGLCQKVPCSKVAWTSSYIEINNWEGTCKACGYEVKGSYCVPKDACKADEFWNTSSGCTRCSGFNARRIGLGYNMMTSEDCKKCGMIEENGFCVRTRGYAICPEGQAFIYPQGCSVPQLNMRDYAIGSEISEADCKKVGGFIVNGLCSSHEPVPECPVNYVWDSSFKSCIFIYSGPSLRLGYEIPESECRRADGYISGETCYLKGPHTTYYDIIEPDCYSLGGVYTLGGYCYVKGCAADEFWNPIYKDRPEFNYGCTSVKNLKERSWGYAIGTEISESDCIKVGGTIQNDYCVKA